MRKSIVGLHLAWMVGIIAVSLQFGMASAFQGIFRGIAVIVDVIAAYVPIAAVAAILAIASRGSLSGDSAATELRHYGGKYLIPLLCGGLVAIAVCLGGFAAKSRLVMPLLEKGGYSRMIPGLSLAAAFFMIVPRRNFRAAAITGVASIIFMTIALMK